MFAFLTHWINEEQRLSILELLPQYRTFQWMRFRTQENNQIVCECPSPPRLPWGCVWSGGILFTNLESRCSKAGAWPRSLAVQHILGRIDFPRNTTSEDLGMMLVLWPCCDAFGWQPGLEPWTKHVTTLAFLSVARGWVRRGSGFWAAGKFCEVGVPWLYVSVKGPRAWRKVTFFVLIFLCSKELRKPTSQITRNGNACVCSAEIQEMSNSPAPESLPMALSIPR